MFITTLMNNISNKTMMNKIRMLKISMYLNIYKMMKMNRKNSSKLK